MPVTGSRTITMTGAGTGNICDRGRLRRTTTPVDLRRHLDERASVGAISGTTGGLFVSGPTVGPRPATPATNSSYTGGVTFVPARSTSPPALPRPLPSPAAPSEPGRSRSRAARSGTFEHGTARTIANDLRQISAAASRSFRQAPARWRFRASTRDSPPRARPCHPGTGFDDVQHQQLQPRARNDFAIATSRNRRERRLQRRPGVLRGPHHHDQRHLPDQFPGGDERRLVFPTLAGKRKHGSSSETRSPSPARPAASPSPAPPPAALS